MSAIRLGLRKAGTPPAEIERFSREALSTQDPCHFEELCSQWVWVCTDRPSSRGAE
ncbi:MAG TPA: hypothetical protein VIA62_00850 [Thermoanaerobaculia bacterium]|nr:hypothetical protein [Thermoanaerobaculia bacterium]